MSLRRKAASSVPETPRVISPSPTPSEHEADCSAPIRPSAATRRTAPSQQPLDEKPQEDDAADEVPGLRRSRTRSRSPIDSRAMSRMTSSNANLAMVRLSSKETSEKTVVNGKLPPPNGHLAPPQPATPSGWSWRDFSRSPSPLGLIPIHRHWRTFVHKHEVPRKVLHVSIGFFVVWLYATGTQTQSVPPYLMAALVPIATTDWLRHRYVAVNRLYVRLLGALMRESEYSGYNGTIFYLLGAWAVLYLLPKDVGVMSVLLLSWCDTAASTFGRLWGRHTPRLRRGKSLAGSLAAFLFGVATSFFFYGWLVPVVGPMPGDEDFMFKGTLSLPSAVTGALGLSRAAATASGTLALSIMSLWSGFVGSASEVIDVFGWDDNLTIPIISGIGIWGFLRLFA
ncbi:phosphatidate cytidylyltransferase family protein [Metarhizium album ARSEF 1941]|uniref:Phosphatidate cytidylyltransferase family protein n=1 Tax=Metarhizium album (strain ARSEF 1941) TaxID=1081103 RepID=A0A0B2X8I2_METAS|nr:phosphatidate cytidylyltransferase family protein [Metarhizium album ARSEF 1941]KHO01830.1 phosphatidate cytidylyltransferase family protein [Metarhizium album ARSEF 1941]